MGNLLRNELTVAPDQHTGRERYQIRIGSTRAESGADPLHDHLGAHRIIAEHGAHGDEEVREAGGSSLSRGI
jgi:hypothetical protein